MEFKEKLQLLRTNMKLSQEELANRLDISRQSVTKWENGQSFPDVQNLIQLSEIFKVSIDRLVKENDNCTINLFCEQKYPMQDIRIFLVRAKNNTYITGENEIMPSQLGSHDFRYEDGDYLYIDTYLGGQNFIGEERVWARDHAVWAMNYYGQSLNENFNNAFLKEALSHVSVSMPFRGPEFYQKGDYIYQCQVQGNFECFKSNLPASDYVINPYVGCPHGCRYCYVCFMRRFTNHSEAWGSFIDIKRCDKPISKKKLQGKSVFLSSVTDCYNPFEEKYGNTRKILEQLISIDCELNISTKSHLILRDMNLLKQCKNLKVSVSVNTLDEQFKSDMDHASSIGKRLETLETLHENGIYTVLFISHIQYISFS